MNVTVLGAGTMGHGIAQVAAFSGHSVIIRDIDEVRIESGIQSIHDNLEDGIEREKLTRGEMETTLDRITGTVSLEAAVDDADLIIEAVPEKIELKREVFADVETRCDDSTVLASNTSSLSITEIAAALDRPDRAIGLHFFNPVHLMQLVEIVIAEQTADRTKQTATEFVRSLDRTPITVRDFPGFASSRLGVAIGVEAIRMVEQGVADAESIDTAMRLGYNHPMGPLELTDLVGLDVRLDVLEYLTDELGDRFRPPQLLKRKVAAGKLGKKTGEGFYRWENGKIVGLAEPR